jgi:acyl transferase domain-containing protein
MSQDDDLQHDAPEGVAIIGFAGRYPGAADIAALWANLRDGVESIRFFTRDELLAAGVDAELIARPDYVPAKGRLDDVELFDASFFGYTPREATAMDPQQRLFLETAWAAMENAGHGSVAPGVSVGVYAASSINTYLLRNWTTDTFRSLDGLELLISSDKDFLATRVAYKLDLKGPAVVVQTACSSSLSAVCTAAQALLDYQCDMALAGGVSVNNPRVGGYVYRPGAIMSPDGHCRAFDADAKGTVSGEGVGIVVLKRLSEAIADRDTIHAVIRGFALNNDGANKIGYTAPSVDGQAEVIRMAQAFAGLGGDDIGYVEAHGTGTDLGDPIEITALTQAFRATTARTGFCGIGSVKTNFGHTDAAAGVTGLLKATLSLAHGQIPPTLHYQRPNPHIDFAGSPFYVIDRLTPWPRAAQPRRAAVSAFGIGGTNAHAILEEAPLPAPPGPARPVQLLVLSARSEAALAQAAARLGAHLATTPEQALADVAHTLQAGRRAFDWRAAVVCRSADEAVARLAQPGLGGKVAARERPMVFAFSGQGAQYPGMGAGLYRDEPVFRAAVDECLALLRQRAGLDLAPLLYPAVADEAAAAALRDTRHAQPALFVTEYALARLWMAWGVEPEAMVGHSIGEYVAACLAGVFTLGDALELVAARGRLVAGLPPGAMLAVPMAEKQLRPLLGPQLSIAAVNAPQLCVVSGETPAVDALDAELRASGLEPVRLHTSHAFHSRMLDPVLDEFGQLVARFRLAPPQRPYLSNLSGDWITPQQATDPRYWVRHLREAVLFGAGVQKLLEDEARVFLEVGPGASLGGLIRQQLGPGAAGRVLGSLRAPRDTTDDQAFLVETLARLWQGGVAVDWRAFSGHEQRRRVPLPTYPFERRRFWVDPTDAPAPAAADAAPRKLADPADWLHLPSWQQMGPARPAAALTGPWLVIADADSPGADLSAQLATQLAAAGAMVQRVATGPGFTALGDGRYTIDPAAEADHEALFDALAAGPGLPAGIVHLAAVGSPADAADDRAFWSPLCTVRAAGRRAAGRAMRLVFVSAGAQTVLPTDAVQPAQALLAGPAQVAAQEYPAFDVRWIDVAAAGAGAAAALLCAECSAPPVPFPLALRGRQRWMRGHAPLPLPAAPGALPGLAAGAAVLVTGGLGGIGLALARGLAAAVPGVRLVLLGRNGLPDAPETARDQRRAAAVQALRAAGAEVLVLVADVADRAQLQAALVQARARFGRIAGVVHAAGLPAGGIMELKTRAAAAAILAPKVAGTLALDALLAGDAPDVFVLCSSLTASLGSAGQVDYTAANAFQDAFAQARAARAPGLTLSIQWDSWRDSGMAVEAELPAALAEMRRQGLATGLSDDEGIEVFRRVLGAGVPQVLVSTRDLARRLRPAPPPAPATVAADGAPAAASAPPAGQVARTLSTPYLAPRNDTERLVAAAWQDLFGIAEMGVHDNFFEADGHSLLAIQIVARLAKDTGVKLPVNAMFEAPTIAQIAERIDGARAQPADDERELAEALAMVEQLSDEEVARLLAGEDGSAP